MVILCFLAAAMARRTAALEIGASESLLLEVSVDRPTVDAATAAASEGGEGVFKHLCISARTTNRR